jgi:hypothetical protein
MASVELLEHDTWLILFKKEEDFASPPSRPIVYAL